METDEWLMTVIQPYFQKGNITFRETLRILLKLNIPFDYIHVKHIFKKATDKRRLGKINKLGVKQIYHTLAYRKEFQQIFNRHSEDGKFLVASNLLKFLQKDQFDNQATTQTAAALMKKYEPIEIAKGRELMTMEGFSRMMISQDLFIFKKEHMKVYQDMNHPICDYFISSSHNTYLIADQLIGQSNLWGYASALLRGCRCLEIDCWDGPNDEPVVYHGHTLTSKLTFTDVIHAIKKYAFTASEYPVILSLENHCSVEQQDVMASSLVTILGEMLLTAPINEEETALPSPEQLKNKIIIKDKKMRREKEQQPTIPDTITDDGHIKEEEKMDAEESSSSTAMSKTKAKKRSSPSKDENPKKAKIKKIDMSMDLSNLVVYIQAKKFVSFENSRATQKFDENSSISENNARKLGKSSARDFLSHTMRFCTRIYPKGTRANSSNYNPQEFWNLGCQMAALNFQTPGVPMDLQNGKFQCNGTCGYILKPEFLRDSKSKYTPYARTHTFDPVTLSIKIISGFQLKANNLYTKGNTADPLVTVEIYGVPVDEAKRHTKVIKHNAFNPKWNETVNFTLHVPELALVRFCVESRQSIVGNEFIGQYTLPFMNMNKGFRHVPLFMKDGHSLDPASLFVHVYYHYHRH